MVLIEAARAALRDYERRNEGATANAVALHKAIQEHDLDKDTARIALAALEGAESFLSGFEDDETQEGIHDIIGDVRKAIRVLGAKA